MQIGGLQKLTLIDYPDKLACTVFLIGCNFRCPWCYSGELVLPEKNKKQFYPVKSDRVGAKQFNGARISEKEFFNFLKKRKDKLEGVVICGGEPTINKELPNFIKKIKKLGFLVKLDTNGSNPKMLKKLIAEHLLDYIAMDIKAPLSQDKYEKATGVKINLEDIKKSIDIIKNSGIEHEFRTTVVPSIHTKEDIIQIAKEISFDTRVERSEVKSKKIEFSFPPSSPCGGSERESENKVFIAKKYYLQNFRSEKTIDPKFTKINSFSDKDLLEIKKKIINFFNVCKIR